ncbi:MAG: ATP-binding protein [Nitrospirota bacterium]
MQLFRTLTGKFTGISLFILLLITVFVYSSFNFTHHMKGEASRINLAGQMRLISFEMAWLGQRIAKRTDEKERLRKSPAIKELKERINAFEGIITTLKNGDKTLNMEALSHYVEADAIFNMIIDEWNINLKPVLLNLIDLPEGAPESQARILLEKYDFRINEYIAQINNFINHLEHHHEKEITAFERLRLYMLIFFIIFTIFIMLYIRQGIVKPLLNLKDATIELEKERFDIRVKVKNADEIGELGRAFNNMAQNLGMLISEKTMLAQSLECSGDAAVVTDAGGIITYANSAAAEQFGYSKDEILGQPVTVIQSKNNPSGLGEVIFQKTLEGGWSGELINVRKDGTEYPVLLTTSSVKDAAGKITALVGISRDISQRKQMEEALKNYSRELEIKVEERTSELKHALTQADAANRAKTEFLANMSHELRTPLNSIMGFTDLILEGHAGSITDQQKKFLSNVFTAGENLLALIDDILDLTKIEAGKAGLELHEHNLNELIKAAAAQFNQEALRRSMKFNIDIDDNISSITADGQKFKQVVANLLSNAFKFTPDAGNVSISARRVKSSESGVGSSEREGVYSEPDRDFIEISVADTGIGISEDDQKRLFQPFQQLDSTFTKKYPGTGLGLNLCKKLVELHNGRIWVESELGKGSRFKFAIPQ